MLRRLLQFIPVFFGATFLIFMLVWAIPGDPIRALAGERSMSESVRTALTERYHLDEPLPVQMDGDPVSSDCPREIEVAPRALWVVVPAGLRTGLFAGPALRPQEADLGLPQRQTG